MDLLHMPRMTRRHLLRAAGGSAAALAFLANTPEPGFADSGRTSGSTPFTLGIASGDPWPNAVVIWTRLAPEPFGPLGGMDPDRSVKVKWQVATDERFHHVVRQGTATAHPEYAFSVHVDVRGLRPDTEYHYRFSAMGHLSDVGRTRTAPAPHANLRELSFAFASCNSFRAGWFTATGHLADEEPDLVFFLGDYIYEYPLTASGSLRVDAPQMPSEFNTYTDSLSRYRLQYAAHKSDPNLLRAHRVAPWIVTWDDHEVVNDTWGYDESDPANTDLLVRRANAYRAFWEHMPLRRQQIPTGPDARIYRRFDFGRLARFSMLDARQYRSKPLSTSVIGDSPERRSPDRTMLGDTQEKWFFDSLTSSTAQWNIVPQGVLMSMLDTDPTDGVSFAAGGWDGYQSSQQRVLDVIARHKIKNFVVLTGDIHRNYILNMLADFDDPDSRVIGAEFAATSLTSEGDGVDSDAGLEQRLQANPHLLWGSLQRGYGRGRLTPDHLRIDIREVDYVSRPDAPVRTSRSFVVESGVPGTKEA
jgi:alkaline phosphatase D